MKSDLGPEVSGELLLKGHYTHTTWEVFLSAWELCVVPQCPKFNQNDYPFLKRLEAYCSSPHSHLQTPTTAGPPRVPPVYNQINELQPRSEVWPEVTAIDVESITPEIYASMHGEQETRKDSIHLVDSFNSPRTKRTQYYHFDQSVKQILLLGDRFIQPKNNHGGVFKQRVAYSEIRSICHDFTDPNKSIILVLSPSDTRHSVSDINGPQGIWFNVFSALC